MTDCIDTAEGCLAGNQVKTVIVFTNALKSPPHFSPAPPLLYTTPAMSKLSFNIDSVISGRRVSPMAQA